MKLFKHQKYAVERYADSSVIPLFLRPGSAKTLTSTAIACEKFRRGMIDALFVVAPNGVDKQWATRELPMYFTECEELLDVTASIYFDKKSKKPIPFYPGVLNIVCVNVDVFSTTASFKRYVDWCNAHKTMIIIDEATRIKNPKAKRTERILYQFNDIVKRGRQLIKNEPKTVARAILTGTPITNGPIDLWSMYEFLEPNYFHMNFYQFQSRYTMYRKLDVNGRMLDIPIDQKAWTVIRNCTTYDQAQLIFGVTLDTYDTIKQQTHYEGPTKHIDELRQKLMKDAMFIRTEDIIDMPATNSIKRYVTMTSEQRRIYDEMEKDMTALVNAAGEYLTATTKLVRDLRLQQICSGFVPLYSLEDLILKYYPDWEDISLVPTPGLLECYKGRQNGTYQEWWQEFFDLMQDPPSIRWIDEDKDTAKLVRIKEDLEEIGTEQVIIITHFTAEAEMLYQKLSKEYSCMLVTGNTRIGTVEDFQDKKYNILIANIKCLSMGFNLQCAHYMMFYSNTFSYEDRDQVTKRIWRIGQQQQCTYFDYLCEQSIDEHILNDVLEGKKKVADSVMDINAAETLRRIENA